MFDLEAFVILSASCSVATLVSVPRQVRALKRLGFSVPAPVTAMMTQSLVLSVVAAALGATFAGRVGLHTGLHGDLPALLRTGVLAGAAAALASMAGIVVTYYGFFRRRLPAREVITSERLRLEMGLLTRMLHGGVVEEVQFRWGLMSLLAWLGALGTGSASALVQRVALVLSALMFALYHLAGSRQIGLELTGLSIGAILVLNIWGGLVFGAVFLRYGLLAAMIGHALTHLIWASFEGTLLDRFR